MKKYELIYGVDKIWTVVFVTEKRSWHFDFVLCYFYVYYQIFTVRIKSIFAGNISAIK
jgi:hypothetical protein